jgi:erythronate-4-phosphate dehydrogenase
MKILADGTLPGLEQAFPKPFALTIYEDPMEIAKLLLNQQILFCRSTLKVNEDLLQGHSLRFVATASSGTDHIDTLYLQNHNIQLIDAKGSNATAVADYVIATVAFLQTYKGFSGGKAGIIGVGEVGSKVAERLTAADMEVLCYDPLRSKLDANFSSCSLNDLRQCDLISVHANLHDFSPHQSRNLLDAGLLKQFKPGVVIINASRGGVINEDALLKQKNALIYCTDVYDNEPIINSKIVAFATLCTPHIAGHSIEAKYAAVAMVSRKLHSYLRLVPPKLIFPAVPQESAMLPASQSWQECVLSLYNPVRETNLLKASNDLAKAFRNIRKAHQNRHDFCAYEARLSDKKTRKILGVDEL